MERLRRTLRILLPLLTLYSVASNALGKEPNAQDVTGILREEKQPGDVGRAVANALLYLPRNVIEWSFLATESIANLVADKHLVPRYRDTLGTPGGDVILFPTVFSETEKPANLGGRLIIQTKHVSTALRAGYGGKDNVVIEGRLRFTGHFANLPFQVHLEGLHERRDDQEYGGLGITPTTDPRNQWSNQAVGQQPSGHYAEERQRLIGSIGWRPARDLEFHLSSSIARRYTRDDTGTPGGAMSDVFAPGQVNGFESRTWIGYAEAAIRLDSRASHSRPSKGFLFESYGGGALDLMGQQQVAFARYGARLAGFIPVYRQHNILSPRIVIDVLQPLSGLPVPFFEVPGQPDFRGYDRRRDMVSMVASLDYVWELLPFMSMGVFVDSAAVAPAIRQVGLKQLLEARLAAGLNLNLYTDRSEIAGLTVAFSPEGVNVALAIGLSNQYGDRQHRD